MGVSALSGLPCWKIDKKYLTLVFVMLFPCSLFLYFKYTMSTLNFITVYIEKGHDITNSSVSD